MKYWMQITEVNCEVTLSETNALVHTDKIIEQN